MEADGSGDLAPAGFDRRAGRHAARQVGHIGGMVSVRLFDHHRISHCRQSFSPACFMKLPSPHVSIDQPQLATLGRRVALADIRLGGKDGTRLSQFYLRHRRARSGDDGEIDRALLPRR